ncbi:peptidylprolyl isomerase [Chryseobacterium indoltheticum]|uniref:Periplasmic chaperone PpiD n=1 Tax=Chryseobacterium indoltheticum TaxID=254 RepID=A0A381F5M7_9FLAO|nr:peptidylprolyl isomerase [Chryseobacterium indoltheticum]AZA72337.1 peptidylprolyl isomerase [Chryseobacterium indoltheticum]SIR10757.1 peptidyl-prolyl cis-trans isomerase D [Chryseobacterium indoltheticum]SUX41899.1 Peptidyl-prolyl cis-trans isomerase surA [Chryseobacterium indoltheticum]
MAILGQIRSRPWLLMGMIALALLAFLVNPESLDKVFGKNPDVLGKVNGEKITREEFNDQLFVLQQQADQQGQPKNGLEEQAWQLLVQSKLVKQQFEKMGFEMTDDLFWNQLQFDQMFAQNQQLYDEKGNFKLQELKKEIETLQNTNPEGYNQWLKTRKTIEYRIMARQVFTNVSAGITTGKKEAEELMKERDQLADIDFVKVDYASYLQKNKIKVTTEDLANYIKAHPVQFKTEPSRNLGIAFFPSQPSPADEAAVQKEITKIFSGGTDASDGKENFQNTTNDSMFVMANSDMPYNNAYVQANQMPQALQGKIETAAIGQVFGPYKEQNLYVLSKLIDKKPSDSTLSNHILIAYKGAERSTATRTKEEAKKIADSLLSVIKGNPAKFAEGLKLSDEPGAVERKGSVGWTTPQSQFAPGYLAFLANNPKGSTGLAETEFGYHIINIDDKKAGTMGYKVAHIVKTIKPSEATEAEVDKKARRFIQQIQGKSFNDFVNIAKKSNYQYSNAKSAKRFDGQLQGLGTDKDGEIIAWAFDKKREKGDTEFFTVEGTGDKVVVYLNGKQKKGLADPESVRDQIETVVQNKLAAKQISDKIGKAGSLDQVAAKFATTKQSAQVNMLNPSVAGAMEPKVAGAAFGIAKGKVSNPIEGGTGVYVIVKKSETINKQPGDIKQFTESVTQRNAGMFGQSWLKSLQDNADIDDYRIEIWGKLGNQQ